jgi:nucleotide-binding universal stress UspA family protein
VAGAAAEAGPGESPAQGLQQLSEEIQPDIVVVGSSHRSAIGQVLAGNVALRLLNGLDRPLAVAPAGYAHHGEGLRTIGVGFDGSPESRAALEAASELAGGSGAELRVMAVTVPQPALTAHPWAFAWGAGAGPERYENRLRESLESATGALPADVKRSTRFLHGGAVTVLVDEADELDLLVLGSRGYGPVRRVLLGSVSSELVHRTPCPLLVIPRPEATGAQQRSATAESAARA